MMRATVSDALRSAVCSEDRKPVPRNGMIAWQADATWSAGRDRARYGLTSVQMNDRLVPLIQRYRSIACWYHVTASDRYGLTYCERLARGHDQLLNGTATADPISMRFTLVISSSNCGYDRV
ncbi:MAG: hypothetical protein H6756_10105 [Candidatus Omnitrophica bacterium]|nr:hypothetical protein [Candidatus Omnitrophota bacterium]